jgi:hypothetical protein
MTSAVAAADPTIYQATTLHTGVAEALGMKEAIDEVKLAVPPRDLPLSPTLGLMAKKKPTPQG